MKKEIIRCKCCDIEIQGEACQLSNYSRVIDGKTYIFCCQTCANQYKPEEEAKTKQVFSFASPKQSFNVSFEGIE